MKKVLIIIIVLLIASTVYGQVETTPAYDKVYDFLKRMQVKGVIDYNSSILPLSREKIANYLLQLDSRFRENDRGGEKSSET